MADDYEVAGETWRRVHSGFGRGEHDSQDYEKDI
jgi:hypothetical protein